MPCHAIFSSFRQNERDRRRFGEESQERLNRRLHLTQILAVYVFLLSLHCSCRFTYFGEMRSWSTLSMPSSQRRPQEPSFRFVDDWVGTAETYSPLYMAAVLVMFHF